MQKYKNKIVVPMHELKGIELAAMKRPSKDGSMAPRIVRGFIEYITSTYGIDLGIETEEMANERETKENRSKRNSGSKLDRKSTRNDFDDF